MLSRIALSRFANTPVALRVVVDVVLVNDIFGDVDRCDDCQGLSLVRKNAASVGVFVVVVELDSSNNNQEAGSGDREGFSRKDGTKLMLVLVFAVSALCSSFVVDLLDSE